MRSVLILVAVVLGAVACCVGIARAHDPYSSWKDNRGYSCCEGDGDNKGDCRAIPGAYVDDNGHWVAKLENGRLLVVPDDAVLRIPSPDGRTHICLRPGAIQPMCFVPGPIMH